MSAFEVFQALPAVPLDDDGTGVRGMIQVNAVDWIALSEFAGRSRPTTDELEAAGDGADELVEGWIEEVAVDGIVPGERRGIETVFTGFPAADVLDRSSAAEAAFGFGYPDVDTSIGLLMTSSNGSPSRFDVVTGGLRPAATLTDLGDGVVSFGTGEDFARNADQITPFQPFGVPLRLAELDGDVAIAESSALIRQWIAPEGARLIDDPRYASLAESFEPFEPIDLWAVETDFSVARERETASIPELLDDAVVVPLPFEVVGAITTLVDDEVVAVVSYVFADEAVASAMAPVLGEIWSSTAFYKFPEPVADFVDVVDTFARGRTATVVTRVNTDRANTEVILGWVERFEHLFLHA